MKMPKDSLNPSSVVSERQGDESAPASQSTKVLGWERWMAKKMVDAFGVQDLKIRLWNGETVTNAHGDGSIEATINDRSAFYQLVLDPDLKFGELYAQGRIDIKGDFIKGLTQYYRTTNNSEKTAVGIWRRWMQGAQGKHNTVGKAKTNIHHHYDVGNDFYRLWLDKEMQYTCAYFPTPASTLEEAQVAKMDHVSRKLQLKPGETVVEAGCGWGGLARHMALNYGVKVRSFNISTEQIHYAKERAKREGYGDKVEYIEDDYRNVSGRYDKFVSVGMLEHVGRGRYAALGEVIKRCLKTDGLGLVHSIGQMQPKPMNPWLIKHIFPGGYAPSIGEMMDIFEPCGFAVLDVENIRLHYAKTLEHWLQRFEQHADEIIKQYDDWFFRTYKLYLAGSEAAFIAGGLQLFQIVFAHREYNDVPWTRDHIYTA